MKKYFFYIGAGLLVVTNVQAQGIKIMPGANFVQTGATAYVVLADNAGFENNAPLSATDIVLKGTGAGNTDLKGSAALAVSQLDVSKTSGQVILHKNLSVSNSVNFNGGLVDLNGNSLLLASSASLVNESETSRITGSTGGDVQITQSLNAPLATNPGNIGIAITSGVDFGSTLIKRSHQPATNVFGGAGIARKFEIVPTNNSALSAQLRAYYFDAETNGLDENKFDLFRSDNGGATWGNIGSSGRDATQNFVNIANIATMSSFTISTSDNKLHVPVAVNSERKFALVQNPVQNMLIVDARADAAATITMAVYDVHGRVVLSEILNIYSGSRQYKTDVSSLPPGNYMINVTEGNVNLWRVQFVKM